MKSVFEKKMTFDQNDIDIECSHSFINCLFPPIFRLQAIKLSENNSTHFLLAYLTKFEFAVKL